MAVRASRSPTDVCGWGGKRGKKNGGEREEKRSRNDEEKGRKARKEKTDGREEESRVIDTSGHLKG